MTSIEQTAYPRFGRLVTARELTGMSPSADEVTSQRVSALSWPYPYEGARLVARSNIAGIGGMAATRVRVAAGSWYDTLPPDLAGRIDLVASNPLTWPMPNWTTSTRPWPRGSPPPP